MSNPTATAEQRFIDLVSGRRRGPLATAGRLALATAAAGYATAMRGRNTLFARGVRRVQDLGRPTISVGNITTGGTGKTPVVAWLASALRAAGARPAVLIRGYRATAYGSDEADVLRRALGTDLPVGVNPDRVAGAAGVLATEPATTCFVLDDGFQHRRAGRDFDLVLIDATAPFGFGHVLPRGLLREPLTGLGRATAILVTRADQSVDLDKTEQTIRRHAPGVPIFRVCNRVGGFIDANAAAVRPTVLDRLALCAGIGNPAAFFAQAQRLAPAGAIERAFPDHHDYTIADLAALFDWAARTRSAALVTTEKDWVKLARLPGIHDGPVPVWRATLTLDFQDGHEAALLELIRNRVAASPV